MDSFDKERLTGIGGSDSAAVLGISPWATPYDIYAQKIGEALPPRANEWMRWGTLLEPLIGDEYARQTGRELEQPALLRHPTHTFMIGHIDRIIKGDPKRIVEIKCARNGLQWGESGTDQVPIAYACQAHHYIALSNADICDIAVLIGGSEFRIYSIPRDDEIIRELIRQEHAFWYGVEHRQPPDPVNVQDAIRRWSWMTAAGTVTAGEAELYAVERLRQIRQAQKTLESEEEMAKLVVMRKLGEAGNLLVDDAGVLLCSWRLDRGRKEYITAARPPARRFTLARD